MAALKNGFRPVSGLTARWSRIDGQGFEHLTLEQNDERITATAVVTSASSNSAFGAWYQIFLDNYWRVKAVSVHRTDSRWFIARSPEPGQWCDGDGGALKKFDGCRDVDLTATPFTLTPMIRRLDLAEGDAHEHDVLTIPLDTVVPARVRQRITCLKKAGRYRIEDLNTDMTIEFNIDRDGLALDEAGRFRRIS